MLRPEQMSKVSVTGSKGIMPTVIETVHEMNLLHLSDYDGSWAGFDNGNPMAGADDAAEKLVTVRALESTLDIDADEAGPGRLPDDWDGELERVRTRVNDLDDERTGIREELRLVEEKIDRVGPFAELGIDLDLLRGYESVELLVGEGNLADVEAALDTSEEIRAFETFTGGDVVAIVAAPTEGEPAGIIDDALVGIEFVRHPLPDTERSPEAYIDELTHQRRQLEADLEEIESDLERVRLDEAGFLLRLEEKLTVEVQRAEAPLQFATTPRAFIAEGWIPSERYDDLVSTLQGAVGESVEVEELERASYNRHGGHHDTEDMQQGAPAAAGDEEGEEEDQPPQKKAATDGGVVTMGDEPPVVQDNPGPARPFEELVNVISRPKYSEFDPSIMLWLTFPFFFGFMISDVGYGILYVLIGYYMYNNLESPALSSLGGVAMWAGGFTIFFGFIFGELFGFHVLGYMLPGSLGGWEKGLTPATLDFALTWLVVSVLFGVLHLNMGYVLDFAENLHHGLWDAITHSGSWLLLLNGIWLSVFSVHGEGSKPEFLFSVFDGEPFNLGFSGLPEMGLFTVPAAVPVAGDLLVTVPLIMILAGAVLLAIGDPIEVVEILIPFAHVLSYTRMAAVLLAKAGMAFVVNMIVFGAVQTEGGSRPFLLPWNEGRYDIAGSPEMFPGLFNMGPEWIIPGVIILVLGHIVVLLLGITSAGLQGIRLEYVEFFGKFYEGGGKNYEPFGHEQKLSED